MTIRYVGIGGDNGNSGLTWALRKLTLNGVEDTPVEAGDTVYVGAGTYREQLTIDVSGSSGNPITYIGDYDGSHTDGVGGVVRIATSAADVSAARSYSIVATAKAYRTFRGFQLEQGAGEAFTAITSVDNFIIEQCIFDTCFVNGNIMSLANPTNVTVRNCYFSAQMQASNRCVYFIHTEESNGGNNLVENCIFAGGAQGVSARYIGDVVVKNCQFLQLSYGVVAALVNTSNPLVVTNSIFKHCTTAIYAASAGQLTENYNTIAGATTARTNVSTGANSLTVMPIFDARWFFELVGGGSMVSPFDLASSCLLIDVAGTSPPTADMRGTTVKGTQREWGALEYDSDLDIAGGGGGAVSIQPVFGRVGL